MCDICERDAYFGIGRGSCTSLGDDAGSIVVYNFIKFKSEDNDELSPSINNEIVHNSKTVYRSEQHINYCPFCGQKLTESE